MLLKMVNFVYYATIKNKKVPRPSQANTRPVPETEGSRGRGHVHLAISFYLPVTFGY